MIALRLAVLVLAVAQAGIVAYVGLEAADPGVKVVLAVVAPMVALLINMLPRVIDGPPPGGFGPLNAPKPPPRG